MQAPRFKVALITTGGHCALLATGFSALVHSSAFALPGCAMKIPENSLFAMLLRTRWWVSFALAAAVALVTGALFPREIAPFAMLATLPFVVIGVIAAWRQLRQPSPARNEQLLQDCAALGWKDFSLRLQQAWQAEGYTVTTRQQADADIQLARDGQLTLVQTKRSKAGVHGIEPLRALHDAAQKAGAASAYVLLQGDLSENARLFARDQHIAVLQNKELAALLHKAPQR